MLHFYTRDGQLIVHQFRMLKQICIITLLLTLLSGVGLFCLFVYHKTTPAQRTLYQNYLMYELKEEFTLGKPRGGLPKRKISETLHEEEFLADPRRHLQIYGMERAFKESFALTLWGTGAVLLLVISYFIRQGYKTAQKNLERGSQLVSPETLTRVIKRAGGPSDLHLDDLPLLKDKETSHLLITGTTGSGKTNCLHTLLPQIRKRPNRAIVVDLTGDFVAKYYRKESDLLLNPFDERSVFWSPWGECQTEAHYDTLAAAIIPKTQAHDQFWENAGKSLLSSALKELAVREEKDIQKLYHLLVRADFIEFSRFFQNTDAAAYTHPDGEKMVLSIRATLANALQSFRFLENTEAGFSIRQWVAEEKKNADQWLFLSCRPDQRETLRPLLSGWLDTAINSLMSLAPDSKRRLWFIIDELPSLQKLPSLEVGLAEGRKYGGCILAGVQSISQISTTYGHSQAHAILDLFNTKVLFRNTDPQTTAWISKVLGEAETTENIENLSYGAHLMRDGVSLAQQTRTKPLVLPSEIATLQDCEVYVRFPGNLPVTKIKMSYKKRPALAKPFVMVKEEELALRQERIRDMHTLETYEDHEPEVE